MYAVRMYALCVRVNVHVQSYTIDLVHESLLISVSIHLYIYIVHLYKKMKTHGFAIAIKADSM